jgi:hypothetical protein
VNHSAQLAIKPVRESIKDAKKIRQDAREVQEKVDCEEVFNTDNTGSVLGNVFNRINNICEHERLE